MPTTPKFLTVTVVEEVNCSTQDVGKWKVRVDEIVAYALVPSYSRKSGHNTRIGLRTSEGALRHIYVKVHESTISDAMEATTAS